MDLRTLLIEILRFRENREVFISPAPCHGILADLAGVVEVDAGRAAMVDDGVPGQ